MPGFNRTGPMGAGPMTGWGRGRCNPRNRGTLPDYGGAGYGRGLGLRRGFGGGRSGMGRGRGYGPGAGWGPRAAAPADVMDPADDLEYLRQQAADMNTALDAVKRRIDVLHKDSTPAESD